MTIEEIFAYFINFISAPLILAIGLIGNTLGLIAFLNKKLTKVGPCIIYQCLFLSDTIYLLQIVVYYLQYTFFIDLTVISRFSCKLFYYLNYVACFPSPWLLVYISIEKCISIVSPMKRLLLKKPLYQCTYIFIVYSFSSLLYTYVAVENDLSGQGNNTVCSLEHYTAQLIIAWMYSISSVNLPFITMILISFMLAIFLTLISFQQRANPEIISEDVKKRLARDRMYTKSSFSMNLVFILLNLPVSIFLFIPDVIFNSTLYIFSLYLQFLSYGINFYVILIMNVKFRTSTWRIIKNKIKSRENIQMIRQVNNNIWYILAIC